MAHTKKAMPPKKVPTKDSQRVKGARDQFDKQLQGLQASAESFGASLQEFKKVSESAPVHDRRVYLVFPSQPIPAEVVERVRKEVFAQELTASEALYGFTGWLTTRDKRILVSAHDNAGALALLTSEFIRHQNLPQPREGCETRVKCMMEVATDVTNEPPTGGQLACILTEDMAADRCITFMNLLSLADQNKVLAKVIGHLDKMRDQHKAAANEEVTRFTERYQAITDANVELDRILDRQITAL